MISANAALRCTVSFLSLQTEINPVSSVAYQTSEFLYLKTNDLYGIDGPVVVLAKNVETLYCHSMKAEQDQAILRLIAVKKTQWQRLAEENEEAQKEREAMDEFFLPTQDHLTKVPVSKCWVSFI